MKKLKELLLLIVFLIMPIIVYFIVLGFKADMISDNFSFVGVSNYIRMFSNDKIFIKALINTFTIPIAFSFLFVFILVLIMFFVRKKVSRLILYIGSVFIGAIISLAYRVYSSTALFSAQSQIYAAQTVVSHIVDYSPSIFNVITIPNVLLSLYVGIFTAFIFWILELLIELVKRFKRRKYI